MFFLNTKLIIVLSIIVLYGYFIYNSIILYYKDSGLVVYGAAIYSEGSQFKFPE